MLQLALRRKNGNTFMKDAAGVDSGAGTLGNKIESNISMGASSSMGASDGGSSNGSGLNSAQLTSMVRACMLEMRRDLEHNLNDRLSGLEDRLNDTIEHLSSTTAVA